MKNKTFKNKIIIFSTIFVISLICRSIVAYLYGDKFLTNEWLILVENLYHHKSLSLIKFNDMFLPNLWMPPIYAYYIYIHTFFFGIGEGLVKSVIISQIFLSSITSVFFFKILKNIFSDKISLLGAVSFSIFPLIVYSASQISSITVYLFLFVFFFLTITNILLKKKFSKYFFGLVSGLLILTSRDFTLIYIFTLSYIFYFKFIKFKNFLIVLTVTLLTLSPYLIRNYIAFDRFIIHSGLGYNLWKAYNPETRVEGYQNSNPKADSTRYNDESSELKLKLKKVKRNKFFRINEDKVYFNQALDYLLNEPSMYINLYFKRLLSFYFIDLNSSQKNYYNFLHIFPNLLISFFSIFGIIVYKKNNYINNYIFLIMLMMVLVYASFAIMPRYKLYILPMQLILSLYFIEYFFKNLFKKN
jgi:4-amino-4-deoxy-L-arabinose transferase-like glycosyltransferase